MNRNAQSTIERTGTDGGVTRTELTDEELADSIRNGDATAFDELYRRHARSARAYARSILHSEQDAEDAAADAFANVLSALRRQGGPRQLFLPYLIACVRNSCNRRQRQRSGLVSLQDRESATVESRPAEDMSEKEVAAKAFACLSNRWQSVLWMAEVQRLDVPAIAHCLELSVPATSAILHRARQAFAESYLSQHMQRADAPTCARLAPKIARYVRGTAGAMSCRQIEAHILSCLACALAVKELTDLNSSLRSVSPPWCGVVGAGGTCAALVASESSAGVVAGLATGWLAKAAVVVAFATVPLITHEASSVPVVAHPSAPAVATTPQDKHPSAVDHGSESPTEVPTTVVATGERSIVKTPKQPSATVAVDGAIPAAALPPIDSPPLGIVPDAAGRDVVGIIETASVTLPAIDPPATVVVSLPGVTAEISIQQSASVEVSLSVPALSVPPISVPVVSVPLVSEPVVSVPVISVPQIDLSCVITFARPLACG